MDNKEVINYLKSNYPKIIINPIKFKEYTNGEKALAFILSKYKLIIGYINRDGYLRKLIKPINITKGKSDIIDSLISKIPIVEGLDEDDEIKLLDILEEPHTKKVEDNSFIIKQLAEILKEKDDSLKENKKELQKKDKKILSLKKQIKNKNAKLRHNVKELKQNIKELKEKGETNISLQNQLKEKDNILKSNLKESKKNIEELRKNQDGKDEVLLQTQLKEQEDILKKNIEELKKNNKELKEKEQEGILVQKELKDKLEQLKEKEKENLQLQNELKERDNELKNMGNELKEMGKELKERDDELKEMENELKGRDNELTNIKEEVKKYKILIGDKGDDFKKSYLLVNEEHEKIVSQIKNQLKNIEEANELCKDRILNEKTVIIEAIKNFKLQIEEQAHKAIKGVIESRNQEIEDANKAFFNLNKMYKKLLEDKKIIETNFEKLKKREEENLEKLKDKEDILTDFSYQLKTKEDEISKLNKNIEKIERELKDTTERYTKDNLQKMAINDFKKGCLKHILEEKEIIINKIKEYNDKWSEWSSNALNSITTINEYTDKLVEESKVVFENLKNVSKDKAKYIKDLEISQKEKDQLIKDLNNNIDEIKFQTEKVINDQILQLGIKTEELKQREEIFKNKENEMNEQYLEYKDTISYLQGELDKVNKLLEEQASQKVSDKKIDKVDDIQNCYSVLQRFIGVNNMFYRKKEIMKILDSLILDETKLSLFSNLSDNIKESIKIEYIKVKDDINKHITFLDLEKYINSPNIEYFKNKNTYDQIPPEFCEELYNISDYWLNNISIYKNQDRILTNIYEDLSGAVRIYIKVKPLQPPTDVIKVNENIRSLVLQCGDRRETFGDFYGVFDSSYSNMDVYTGNYQVESINNIGLYNSFKQVEDGYSIVLFGYGISGSGKTTLLLGESKAKIPGILHHGISNLRGVKNIKVRNIFEQYIKDFIPTINKMKGKIHNLVRGISQLKDYSIDETANFASELPVNINLDNIQLDDLYTITNILEKYRIENKRIKSTPNNPVSSRSHLYIVLEILFESGKTGYITVVDTAGKEKPIDIYNKFLDISKRGANLTTLLGPTGGSKVLETFMKTEYTNEYDSKDVFNILREGFFTNETLNHLVYFFNKKNYKDIRISKQTTLDNYSGDKYYVDPRKEEDMIDPNNNCLTIPIMKFLDSLSKKKGDNAWHPTKFITFMCLRQEEIYCNETFDTMEFANKIKST